MTSKMTQEKGLEHIKDGIDCQLEAARSLNKVKRAFPTLSPKMQEAFDLMDKVKSTLREAEVILREAHSEAG